MQRFLLSEYTRQGSKCIDCARMIDAVSGVSARESGAGEVLSGVRYPPRGQLLELSRSAAPIRKVLSGMRRARHALTRCDGVAVRISRGVHAEASGRANSHREGGARSRT